MIRAVTNPPDGILGAGFCKQPVAGIEQILYLGYTNPPTIVERLWKALSLGDLQPLLSV